MKITTKLALAHASFAYRCTLCKQRPGQPCRNRQHRIMVFPHTARLLLAKWALTRRVAALQQGVRPA